METFSTPKKLTYTRMIYIASTIINSCYVVWHLSESEPFERRLNHLTWPFPERTTVIALAFCGAESSNTMCPSTSDLGE